jgi:hypothetical protein
MSLADGEGTKNRRQGQGVEWAGGCRAVGCELRHSQTCGSFSLWRQAAAIAGGARRLPREKRICWAARQREVEDVRKEGEKR